MLHYRIVDAPLDLVVAALSVSGSGPGGSELPEAPFRATLGARGPGGGPARSPACTKLFGHLTLAGWPQRNGAPL